MGDYADWMYFILEGQVSYVAALNSKGYHQVRVTYQKLRINESNVFWTILMHVKRLEYHFLQVALDPARSASQPIDDYYDDDEEASHRNGGSMSMGAGDLVGELGLFPKRYPHNPYPGCLEAAL